MSAPRDLLVDAIAGRREIEFDYAGLPRRVIPAALGYTRTGTVMLNGYQVGGGSRSGLTHGKWRMFDVGKMSRLRATATEFADDPPGYRPFAAHLPTIIAQL